ncbi:adenylate/guanylate cyclase domain-containing protein [Pelagibius marinus]|uniref:adenylate/guanylate cyclase domain-containing protein n=1 Tax=Pelagibius marinus TaxID=2762760 RepID=UPI00187272EC|nr:adenylate/guanylate cyclase domain-containing protein [Pelagibius marinus]
MKLEDFFNQHNIVDLSFFNFRNAITACYFANKELQVLKVNDNFKSFFPVLGNVTNVYFPDVLEQLGVPGAQIENFVVSLNGKGSVLIPEIHINLDGEDKVFSLLSTRTTDDVFSYLNGVQGQFVDRTAEWKLKRDREELLEQKIRDREIIEEKSRQLESLATRLAKYLSPQIYQTIFSHTDEQASAYSRKNLTIFLSDIVQFTDLSDSLEPERLAKVVNSYLSEMASIALDCGGTIDKFIGDAILVFFGDPESEGETEDALRCVEMALRMRARAAELQKYWQKLGVSQGLHVRMGIATGFCTVGNFGSEQRLDYTVLGSPVNLASRLEVAAKPDAILVDENTHSLIQGHVHCTKVERITPKGFARPIQVYQVDDFLSEEHRNLRRRLSRVGERVEVNVIDSSDIRAAIEELRRIQEEFEVQFAEGQRDAGGTRS